MGRRDNCVRRNNNNNNNVLGVKSEHQQTTSRCDSHRPTRWTFPISTATARCSVNVVQTATECGTQHRSASCCSNVQLVRNLVAHGDARVGKRRGNWRIEWVASTLTPPPNVVYPALLKLIRTPRLPAVDWTDTPTDLNGLVRFGERRNLVPARVPSRSARAIIM